MINNYIDSFLRKDFFSNFGYKKKGYRIGWVVPVIRSYKSVMASTRIRVYDIINILNSETTGLNSSLYRNFSNYDVVVFQKAFGNIHRELAQRLKRKKVKIIFDINVNYVTENITQSPFVTKEQTKDVKEMMSLSDGIIVTTRELYNVYKNYHEKVIVIEEGIPQYFFKYYKEHKDVNPIKLVYCGYAVKAKEVKLIAKVLKKNKKTFRLITICDQDPKLDFIDSKYIKYDISKLPEQMLEGDIAIAPRDLTVEYNLGHAFTKIGYPMSVGLSVLASPVPSYKESPAILCRNTDEWEYNLNDIANNLENRKNLAKSGREYTLSNYSLNVIGKKYIQYFTDIVRE